MKRDSGFTLPETLVATAIVVSALAGIAWIFSMGVATNLANRHRASAALAASAKLEEFASMSRPDPRWNPGGGLDPVAPIPGYFDRVTLADTSYLRLWQIVGGGPMRTIEVAVYSETARLPGERESPELIRLSTTRATGF